MKPAPRPFLAPAPKASVATRRTRRLASGWAVAMLMLASPALSDPAMQASPAAVGEGGCRVLRDAYQRLHNAPAVPEAERRRLTDSILNTCGTVDAQLVRATTLDGAAVLQVPLAQRLVGEVGP